MQETHKRSRVFYHSCSCPAPSHTPSRLNGPWKTSEPPATEPEHHDQSAEISSDADAQHSSTR